MAIHRSKATFSAILILVTLLGVGCSGSQGSKQTISEKGETTVVIDNLESVLPREGAALEKQVLEDFRGFDFLSDAELLGYRFSESVFGDDRGLWRYNLSSKIYGESLDVEIIPKIASLSKDKSKLVLVPDGPAGSNKILLYDIKTGKTNKFDLEQKNYLFTFNWQYYGDGLTSVSKYTGGKSEELVLRLMPDNTLQKYTLAVPDMHFIDPANFYSDGEYLYYALYGPNMGVYRYSWETQKKECIAPNCLITRMYLSPKGDRFAFVEGFKDTRDKTKLNIVSKKGKKLYTIFESIAIESVAWQPDGKGLVFAAINQDVLSNLYYADLETGQLHFLGEYPGYCIEKLAFDPEGNKLMLTYFNRCLKIPKWTTHILTLRKGEGIYEK